MSTSRLTNIEQRISEIQFQLQYKLQPLEDLRLEFKRKQKNFWITFILLFLTIISLIVFFPIFTSLAIVLIIGSIIWYIYKISPTKKILSSKFHGEIVPHIVSEFLSEAHFQSDNYISKNAYINSNIFRKSIDRYNGSNLVVGSLGNTSISFSNLHTEYETKSTDSKGNTDTQWDTIFKGIFLIADSNKNFNGEIYILPDTAERMLGGLGRWMQDKFGSTGRGEMIYMEDPIFEKNYVVYATDPVEARYILTPSMQQYFIDLSNTYGKEAISASFIDGNLYLAISGSFKLFTLNTSRSFNDVDTTRYYVKNLIHILSAVEILDLNTRIWNK